MDMRTLTHLDGRPVTFEKTSVMLIEPHESGQGTFVRLGPADHVRDLHVSEDYKAAHKEVMQDHFARYLERAGTDREEDVQAPF